jgi:hypothetical protein
VEVDPSELRQGDRDAIAVRLKDSGELWQLHRHNYLHVNEPTLAGIMEAIKADEAACQKEKEEQAKKKAEALADALDVLRERRTKTTNQEDSVTSYSVDPRVTHSDVPNGYARWEVSYPDWEYTTDREAIAVRETDEAVAWTAELVAKNEAAEAEAKAKVRAELVAKIAAYHAEQQKALDWIETHGSNRLRRMVAEGIEHEAVYRSERIKLELPSWRFEANVPGEAGEARNVPSSAFTLLDEARALRPDAKLRYWTIDHEHTEECYDGRNPDEDCPAYDYTGYVALDTFLGKEIVYGGPDPAKWKVG